MKTNLPVEVIVYTIFDKNLLTILRQKSETTFSFYSTTLNQKVLIQNFFKQNKSTYYRLLRLMLRKYLKKEKIEFTYSKNFTFFRIYEAYKRAIVFAENCKIRFKGM